MANSPQNHATVGMVPDNGIRATVLRGPVPASTTSTPLSLDDRRGVASDLDGDPRHLDPDPDPPPAPIASPTTNHRPFDVHVAAINSFIFPNSHLRLMCCYGDTCIVIDRFYFFETSIHQQRPALPHRRSGKLGPQLDPLRRWSRAPPLSIHGESRIPPLRLPDLNTQALTFFEALKDHNISPALDPFFSDDSSTDRSEIDNPDNILFLAWIRELQICSFLFNFSDDFATDWCEFDDPDTFDFMPIVDLKHTEHILCTLTIFVDSNPGHSIQAISEQNFGKVYHDDVANIAPFFACKLRFFTAISDSGDIDYSYTIFKSILPRTFFYNNIVRDFLRTKIPNRSVPLYILMFWSKHSLYHLTFPFLLKYYSHLSSVQLGVSIHCHMKLGLKLDQFMQNSFIHMYALCNDIVAACKMFEDISLPNGVSWSELIDGYAKYRDLVSSRGLFDRRSKRNVASWSTMMQGYVKSGVREVLALLEAMLALGSHWNAVMLVTNVNEVVPQPLLLSSQFGQQFQQQYSVLWFLTASTNAPPRQATSVGVMMTDPKSRLSINGKLLYHFIGTSVLVDVAVSGCEISTWPFQLVILPLTFDGGIRPEVSGSGIFGVVFSLITFIIGARLMVLLDTMKILDIGLGFGSIILMGTISKVSIKMLAWFSALCKLAFYGEVMESAPIHVVLGIILAITTPRRAVFVIISSWWTILTLY